MRKLPGCVKMPLVPPVFVPMWLCALWYFTPGRHDLIEGATAVYLLNVHLMAVMVLYRSFTSAKWP